MEVLAIKVLLGPGLVVVSTLAGRQLGPAVGGWFSALPVIAGPVLLVVALEHGERFAARSAVGTLVGLVGVSAFIAGYALLARRAAGPMACLLAGWTACLAVTAGLRSVEVGPWAAAAMALGSLAAASAILGRQVPAGPGRPERRGDLPARAAATALLVLLLSFTAGAFGPHTGGLLVALPVLASLLALFTHSHQGGPAAIGLLRGMLVGLIGFTAFILTIAEWLPTLGIPIAFGAAAAVALALQVATMPSPERTSPGWQPTRVRSVPVCVRFGSRAVRSL